MKKLIINKILVPLDFSNNSMNALQTAIALAKKNNARIKLFYVIDEDFKHSGLDTIKSRSATETYIKAITRLAASVRNSDNISCDLAVLEGAITGSIIHEASHYGADLIVMGKNGNAGARKNYAGSVSYQVVKKSGIPVLLVPAGKTYENFDHILFPSRPIMSVLDKYDAIEDFIINTGASLHIQNLRNPDHPDEVHIITHLTEIIKSKAARKGLQLDVQYYFENGHFANYILGKINDLHSPFSLVIITAEIDKRINDFYMGSYAQAIIHQSPIPVLVFRPEKLSLSQEKMLEKLELEIV